MPDEYNGTHYNHQPTSSRKTNIMCISKSLTEGVVVLTVFNISQAIS